MAVNSFFGAMAAKVGNWADDVHPELLRRSSARKGSTESVCRVFIVLAYARRASNSLSLSTIIFSGDHRYPHEEGLILAFIETFVVISVD
jgi:hypothetical protein